MLIELHVKNLALIERADMEFAEGLTILSGETGAGKSILIDSINVALGAKTGRGIIRSGSEAASVELVFAVDDPEKQETIRAMGIPMEEDLLILSRKITPTRSVAKINDETVTAARLRSLTGLLIDLHGQFEHQSLLSAGSHLSYLDQLAVEDVTELKHEIARQHRDLTETEEELTAGTDRAMREREADILRYEIRELEDAALRPGEEEELLNDFRRMKNASRITRLLGEAESQLDTDAVTKAVKALSEATSWDDSLEELKGQAAELESLLDDARRNIRNHLDGMSYDEETFVRIEKRLDVIHRMQGKYGDDLEEILRIGEEKKERLAYLEGYDDRRAALLQQRQQLTEKLTGLCDRLHAIRQKTADLLGPRIEEGLRDLNFLGVRFEIAMERLERFTDNGNDSVQFLISTNPGQPVKPLQDVASGGELSRIMLVLKSILADTDEIETLIFDEIDAGISGRTAQKVAEKLRGIGKGHQVLCITHLPQIAAMADHHYLISKSTDGMSTRTEIRAIEGEDAVAEIARMMGGSEITDSVMHTAREMKEMANQ